MKANWTYAIPLIILILTSCIKEDDNLIKVVVQGRVFDDNRQLPVKGIMVYLYDVECRNFNCNYSQTLDSTRTDVNGHYEFNYKIKNRNSLYVICGYPEGSYATPSGQDSNKEVKTGKSTINFKLRKTSVLKAKVIISNNPYPPFKIIDHITSGQTKIYGTNKDTVVYLRGVANQSNPIHLLVSTPNQSYFKRRLDHFDLGPYADTFSITIKADPNTFP